MRIHAIATVASLALALSAAPAFAKKDKVDKDHTADPHMSTQGTQNTNSAYSADRDKGQERAAERMSASGTANTHSGDPQKDKEKKAKKK